jgi:hypothetical protein
LLPFLRCRYGIPEATWEGKNSFPDPVGPVKQFEKDAMAEGRQADLSEEKTILLKEAVTGGWLEV